jgi:hypothetical protein
MANSADLHNVCLSILDSAGLSEQDKSFWIKSFNGFTEAQLEEFVSVFGDGENSDLFKNITSNARRKAEAASARDNAKVAEIIAEERAMLQAYLKED